MANFKNKKLLMTLVTGLAGVAIIGTGFASWVITYGVDPTSTGNVSFDAEVVVDGSTVTLGTANTTYYFTGRSPQIAVEASNENAKNIKFGPIASTKGNWLSSDLGTNNVNEERLKVVTEFPITVTATSSQTTLDITKLVFSVDDGDDDDDDEYGKLATAGIVGALPTFNKTQEAGFYSIEAIDKDGHAISNAVDVTEATGSETTGTGTITFAGMKKLRLTVWFAWGSHFGGANPITYYNGETATDINPDGVTFNSTARTIEKAKDPESYSLDAQNAIRALGLLDKATYSLSFHLAVAPASTSAS